MIATEYIGAIAVVIVGVLHAFGINIGNDIVSGLITGVVGLWIAIKRHQQGDITLGGIRKA